jgi:hypothetical protein
MMQWIAGASPRSRARLAGVLYLLTSVAAVFDQFLVLGRIVVHGDAAATSSNVLAHESMFRAGFAADLVMVACYVGVTAFFYGLFEPVDRTVALLAAFFSLVSCAVQAFGSLFHLAPLLVLGGAPYLNAFDAGQRHALALLLLELNAQAFNIGLGIGGFYILLIGYLILRSTFLPRILGALLVVAGLGYLTFLSPPLASHLAPYNVTPAGLGENALTIWLIVIGVNVQRWQEQARKAGMASPGDAGWLED